MRTFFGYLVATRHKILQQLHPLADLFSSHLNCSRKPRKINTKSTARVISRTMQLSPKELYPLSEAVAVCRLTAPRPDMDVVLGRLGELRRVFTLLLAAILAVALRGLPLGGVVLRAIALVRRFAPLPAGFILQNAPEVKSFAPKLNCAANWGKKLTQLCTYLGEILCGGGPRAVLAFPLPAGLPFLCIAVGRGFQRHLRAGRRRIGH